MELQWISTTEPPGRAVNGWIADGEDWRYWILSDRYHGGWVLTRVSAEHWAESGKFPAMMARQALLNAIRVIDPEDARRMAGYFEGGGDIDGEPAWAHKHEGR